jgi:hypothetical protein
VHPSIAKGAINNNLAVVRPPELQGNARSGNRDIQDFFVFVARGYVDWIGNGVDWLSLRKVACLRTARFLSPLLTVRKRIIKW